MPAVTDGDFHAENCYNSFTCSHFSPWLMPDGIPHGIPMKRVKVVEEGCIKKTCWTGSERVILLKISTEHLQADFKEL